MKHISAYAKTATALCALALLAGCGTETDDGPEESCFAAYDEPYVCRNHEYAAKALKKKIDKPIDCSDFKAMLDDGLYWLEVLTSTGDTESTEPMVRGETGWLSGGSRYKHAYYADLYINVCNLDSITADSILVGGCRDYDNWCNKKECTFRMPVHLENHESDVEGALCIAKNHPELPDTIFYEVTGNGDILFGKRVRDEREILDSIMANPSVYRVSVSDTAIAISILGDTVTWTKRTGLLFPRQEDL